MKRQIIKIDEAACNGCGLCVSACHEGAITMVDGKARLIRDDYCDGLGNCLPACPTGAITFEEREAAAYDEAAVEAHLAAQGKTLHKEEAPPQSAERIIAGPMASLGKDPAPSGHGGCSCPGSMARTLNRPAAANAPASPNSSGTGVPETAGAASSAAPASELRQWPVQIKLAPVNAGWLDGANLLIAADCAAYAYATFHQDFIKNRITLIGCPKLDEGDYTEKLTAILANNNIKSLTVVRMEVPCCSGLARSATEALKASGKFIPWQVVTISTDGKRLD